MKDFFQVKDIREVLEYRKIFPVVGTETVSLTQAGGRILAEDIVSDIDLPAFSRTTVDGYAVYAASTFGAGEANPSYLRVIGDIRMGRKPDFSIGPGEAARISTGGMMPPGADSAVMIEHTEALDASTLEVYKSAAPGQHVIEAGEDFQKSQKVLCCGQKLRAQEVGLLAAFGKSQVQVYQKPVVGIISTGDEVVPVDQFPENAQIRDINSYTLACLAEECGACAVCLGIIRDDFPELCRICAEALERFNMILISGGSSVGGRDFTADVIRSLPESEILVHGISISPGKPTILARAQNKAFWGLPGHVVSAMVVFKRVVKPFIEHISGSSETDRCTFRIPARLSRNLASAQGRTDFVRVRLTEDQGGLWAEPVLGKSGLINTMIKADGMIEIGRDVEGLDQGETVWVTL